jgi:hypothetical protein
MSDTRKPTVEPPAYLREHLPSPEQLKECLTNEPFAVGGEAQLYRAAYLPQSVLPMSVARAYRFGPPAELYAGGIGMPFWWLYAAYVCGATNWMRDARQTR